MRRRGKETNLARRRLARFPETQPFSENAGKPPISAAVTGTGNSSVLRQMLGVPKTHTFIAESRPGTTTDEKSLFDVRRNSNVICHAHSGSFDASAVYRSELATASNAGGHRPLRQINLEPS
jgi:hypothetical protein